MNKKKFILAILLILIACLSTSSVFAENATDIQYDDSLAIDNNDVLTASHTISPDATSDDIQNTINSMSDGDTLNFENGTYTDICIYINKSITVNGNGATLVGFDNPSKSTTPSIITNSTADGGYGISNLATLYVLSADNVTLTGLNIVAGENSASSTAGPAYSNALVFVDSSNNLILKDNVLDGSSWGLYLRYSADGQIVDNVIKNQAVTGILSFGSARTQIERNKVINAKNHGIDVRHGTGPNVQVINNTVIGSKEGIYLMHSRGHTAAFNNIINCTISSISCYGSSNIQLYNNTLFKSRIGVLLGGGYSNITVGTNDFKLENLPYPPTFVYNIAEAQSDYQSDVNMMGTHSDSSSYSPAYKAYTEIPTPKDISIDYNLLLSKSGTEFNVPAGTSSSDIQKMIDTMKDGDTLSFEKNGIYKDISIYIDKNIKIFGNNATLTGYDNVNLTNVPEKITATTANGGYAITERAVLYSVNNSGVVISDLNIVSKYPGYDPTKINANTNEYKTAGIRAKDSKNITITKCNIDGASWGIYLEYSGAAIVTNNNIQNQFTTGILNFGTPQSIITGNTITNAVNHGIDVRHGTGPKVTVFNNTVIGTKEGIYLMHSQGHNVYNNTIIDSKISGITAYGSGNENIFNNSINGSRIGILLGGGYYNVTIGPNTYNLDFLPFPPTFVTYLAKAESKYYQNPVGTYSNTYDTILSADDAVTGKDAVFEFELTNVKGTGLENKTVTVVINNETYTAVTDENGTGKVSATLDYGVYPVEMTYAGEDAYVGTTGTANLKVGEDINTIISFTEINGGCTISGILKDVEGTAMGNANLTCVVGDENVNITTDENGMFTVQGASNTPVTVSYAGSAPYLASEAKITLKDIAPKRAATVINGNNFTQNAIEYKAGERGGNFTVQLVDASGNVLANKTVLIGYNGKMLERTTDEKGFAAVQINLQNANTLTFAVTFLGDDNYNATMSVYLITIEKKPVTITASAKTFKASAKTKKYTVTLSTVPGVDGKTYFAAGKKVTLTINGKTYSTKMNNKGQATFALKITKKGTFKGTVKYAGDNTYNSASKKVQIKIK